MAKPYRLLREKMTPESRARAEARTQEILRDMPLDELREARELTQEHLARILHVTQAAISKMERRTDMYVSTLRDFIEAIGGQLEIRALFPDGVVRINQFGRLGSREAAEPNRDRHRWVLLVEGETEIRQLAADVLRGEGYRVETAADGLTALKRVDERPYALIVSDLQMPHLDGSALVRILRDRYGSAGPAVILTTDPDKDHVPAAMLDDLRLPVLPKPFDRKQFREAVKRVLSGEGID